MTNYRLFSREEAQRVSAARDYLRTQICDKEGKLKAEDLLQPDFYQPLMKYTNDLLACLEEKVALERYAFWADTEANTAPPHSALPLVCHWQTPAATEALYHQRGKGVHWSVRKNNSHELTPITDPDCVAILNATWATTPTDEQLATLKERLGLEGFWCAAVQEYFFLDTLGAFREFKELADKLPKIKLEKKPRKSKAAAPEENAAKDLKKITSVIFRDPATRRLFEGCNTYFKSPRDRAQLDLPFPEDEPLPTIFRKHGNRGVAFRLRFNELAENLPLLKNMNSELRQTVECACTLVLQAHPEIINEIWQGKRVEDIIREPRPTTSSYNAMHNLRHKTRMNQKQKSKIRNLLWRLNACLVEWIRADPDPDGFHINIDGDMPKVLDVSTKDKWNTATQKMEEDEGYFIIKTIPFLLAYAIYTKCWEQLEADIFSDLPYKQNPQTLKLTYYLLDSVQDMKNPNAKTRRSNHILAKTLVEFMTKGRRISNATSEKDRITDYATKCLNHFKAKGLLAGWEWEDQGAADLGVIKIDVMPQIEATRSRLLATKTTSTK